MRSDRSRTILVIACSVVLLGLAAAAGAAVADARPAAAVIGPYQIATATAGEWVIVNTTTGRFERWVYTGERYTIEASGFGEDGFTDVRFVRVGRP